jgi:PEGA domain
MARNSADVIDGAIQEILPANDDSPDAHAADDVQEASEQRLIERSPGLPLTAAEDPQWDDDREETYAADFDRLAPWRVPEPPRSAGDRQSPGTVAAASVPDLSDSSDWEEAKTAYFERTANFELLDSKFVQEYTDRLPGGLRDLVLSETEPARPIRKSSAREPASGLSAAALFGDLDPPQRFDREQSELFAYQVSPRARQSVPAPQPQAKPAASNAPRAADKLSGPRRRAGSETIRERGRSTAPSQQPTAAKANPVAPDSNALEFDEVSVATARGGRRFAPERHPASQPAAASFPISVKPTLRSPLARNTSQAPAPLSEPVSQNPTRPSRPSRVSHPEPPRSAGDRRSAGTVARASVVEPPRSAGDRRSAGTVARASVPSALPVSAGFDSESAELRDLRRHQTATWVWFTASALAGVMLVLVVRAWTTGSLTFHDSPAHPSVAVETTVSAAGQQTDTGFSITSQPEGAHIFVDGRSTGFVTPAQIRALSPGLHSVELKLDGHYDTSLPAVIQPNTVLELEPVALRPHPVESQPVASVSAVAGIAPKLTAAERRAARREARAARREARLARQRAITRNAPMRGLDEAEDQSAGPAGEGTLRINSRPWARVLIDNKFVGNTPQRALRVAAGDHSVRLINEPLNMSKSFRITIREGETLTRVEMLNEDADQSQATSSRSAEAYAQR